MSTDNHTALFHTLQKMGYPGEFCKEIAYKQMNTDYLASRMLGYLRCQKNPRIEDLVDEMFAIISDRDRFMQKHEAQSAQARINQIYNEGLMG